MKKIISIIVFCLISLIFITGVFAQDTTAQNQWLKEKVQLLKVKAKNKKKHPIPTNGKEKKIKEIATGEFRKNLEVRIDKQTGKRFKFFKEVIYYEMVNLLDNFKYKFNV